MLRAKDHHPSRTHPHSLAVQQKAAGSGTTDTGLSAFADASHANMQRSEVRYGDITAANVRGLDQAADDGGYGT